MEMAMRNLEELLNALMDEACRLTGSSLSYFAAVNETEDVVTMLGWSMSAMSNCAMLGKPIVYVLEKMGLWGDCVRERKAIITNDYKSLKKPTKKGYPAGHVDIDRHMNVPVFEDSRIVGIMGVGNKAGDYLDGDARLLAELTRIAWPIIKSRH
jgi:two-component system, OmpR family, phosphate regulon sensor histidine kinase PhoR